LSTLSPIANFAIENSFWNHRRDYPTKRLTLLKHRQRCNAQLTLPLKLS
jgi:hypothetical protein